MGGLDSDGHAGNRPAPLTAKVVRAASVENPRRALSAPLAIQMFHVAVCEVEVDPDAGIRSSRTVHMHGDEVEEDVDRHALASAGSNTRLAEPSMRGVRQISAGADRRHRRCSRWDPRTQRRSWSRRKSRATEVAMPGCSWIHASRLSTRYIGPDGFPDVESMIFLRPGIHKPTESSPSRHASRGPRRGPRSPRAPRRRSARSHPRRAIGRRRRRRPRMTEVHQLPDRVVGELLDLLAGAVHGHGHPPGEAQIGAVEPRELRE